MAKKQAKKAGRPPLDPKGSVTITAKIPTPLAKKLEAWAEANDCNRSQAITEAIRKLVEN